jgi:NAD(P)-dependent dehydrogenase (short-subunit alcohol dehydrogenase family)
MMMSLPVISPDQTAASIAELMSLRDRVAVVTGGARGIGAAISRRLAEAGASVVVADIDVEAAKQTAAEIAAATQSDVRGAAVDVQDSASVEALADLADDISDGLRIWVNNAGIYPSAPLVDVTDDEWDRMHSITLRGTFFGSRAAARRMLEHPGAHGRVVINLSSMAGLRGRPNLTNYVAAKHGVSGLVRSMAVELGPSGIRVLGLAPSVVHTPGLAARRVGATPEQIAEFDAFEARMIGGIPLRRAGVPDDVARLALYCASDLSEYVSGLVLPIDGGLSAS